MEEQVISKSTAELAKEVGFNISSYKYYLTHIQKKDLII